MRDIAINLLASIVAGLAVWVGQRLARYRNLARKRQFFGVVPDGQCLLVVSKHASSPRSQSIHKADVAALVELSVLVRECGGRPVFVMHDQAMEGLGNNPEFCIGGPEANTRTAAHLRWILRGVRLIPFDPDAEAVTYVGRTAYQRVEGVFEYVVVARAPGPAGGAPVFILCGQTAATNHAAARYLTANHRELRRRYGMTGRFALVLRIVDPPAYGNNVVEFVDDVTAIAFDPPTERTPPRGSASDTRPSTGVGRDANPPSAARSATPSSKDPGSSSKDARPSSEDARPSSEDAGPPSRNAWPSSKDTRDDRPSTADDETKAGAERDPATDARS